MKKVFLICTILLLHLQGFSQFLLHTVFPMGVSGSLFDDTLLNTSTILKREGIKKIISNQTSPEITKTFSSKTLDLTAQGKIKATLLCFRNAGNRDSGFCITDTILYDAKEQMTELISKDAKGKPYLQYKADYISQKEVKYTLITTIPSQAHSDTVVDYHHINDKGQLVRVQQERREIMPVNASLYYNEDGLLDSISYENPAWSTFVFKRKEKESTKK